MKKYLCLLLACVLYALSLTACSSATRETQVEAIHTDAPEYTPIPEDGEGSHGEVDQSQALEDMPTLEPPIPVDTNEEGEEGYFSIDALINDGNEENTATSSSDEYENDASQQEQETVISYTHSTARIDPSTYQFSALIDTSLGFTFNYPSHWENVPGVYTVCFREKVEPGDFPARVAITAKRLVHSPEGTVMTTELTSYMRTVYRQYEASTFEAGTPNSEDTFMGKPALSNTYLAYSGDTEVKGFVIGCAVGRVLYVFHFCASYEDYIALESVMRYMLKSVTPVEE